MTNRVICGDCLEVPLPSNYFDTLITDPPYGLGFMGKDWDAGVPGKVFWKKFLDACKPGAFAFVFGGTRTYHRLACAIEDAGWEIRDCISFLHDGNPITSPLLWITGQGFPKSHNFGCKCNEKKTDDSGDLCDLSQSRGGACPKCGGLIDFKGYGTALKPSVEMIVVAMKPLDGTLAHNAEKWGVGGLWIDGGRIGTEQVTSVYQGGFTKALDDGRNKEKRKEWMTNQKGIKTTATGRWPANVILDEEAGVMLDEQSGTSKSSPFNMKRKNDKDKEIQFMVSQKYNPMGGYTDSGGASRFFYCSKASKRERGEGNSHCTVKPLALMEYLCKLSRTPTGGIVLDPFAGSGTTALACVNTDRQYMVIEKEHEYCEIIAARLGGMPVEVTIPQRPKLSPTKVTESLIKSVASALFDYEETKMQMGKAIMDSVFIPKQPTPQRPKLSNA